MKVKLKRTHELAKVPTAGTAGAAGYDLCTVESVFLHPGETVTVDTGWNVEVEPGWEMQVRSRSGLAAKNGVMVLNSPGTIDEDYRGPLKVILHNASSWPLQLHVGDRVAQVLVKPAYRIEFDEVDSLSETARGENGLGSTGVK